MQIDTAAFVNQIEAPTTHETQFYLPRMVADFKEIFSKFKGSDETPQTIMGRRILSHCYGEKLALIFKRWVFGNYSIDNAAGEYDTLTDTTGRLPA